MCKSEKGQIHRSELNEWWKSRSIPASGVVVGRMFRALTYPHRNEA